MKQNLYYNRIARKRQLTICEKKHIGLFLELLKVRILYSGDILSRLKRKLIG